MKNLSAQFISRSMTFFGMVLVALSQFVWLGDLPGIHFDEAWQLELSYRLAFIPGFQQWSGMNDYTLSVLSHLLEFVLKWGSGSWIETRVALSIFTLLGVFGITRLVQKRIDVGTANLFLLVVAPPSSLSPSQTFFSLR